MEGQLAEGVAVDTTQPLLAVDLFGLHAAGVAILAVVGVVEAEAALEAQPAILAAGQAQAIGMDALVQPDDAGRRACIAAERTGPFGRGTRGIGVCFRVDQRPKTCR